MKTTAREIMSSDVLYANEGISVEEALKLLVNSKITGFPVVDVKGKMIGIYSEYDALMQIAQKSASTGKSASVFREPIEYSKKVEAIPEGMGLEKIVKIFIDFKYRRLPVIDPAGKLVGIITRRDLMRLYYYRAKLT